MAIDQWDNPAASPRFTKLQESKRRTVTRYEDERTKIRLQEALVREKNLLRQLDELTQRRPDVSSELYARREDTADRFARLTPRQRQIMELVLAGDHNKTIAAEIGISQRTVENHRAAMMRKTGAKSLPDLARLALAAAWDGNPDRDSSSEPIATQIEQR